MKENNTEQQLSNALSQGNEAQVENTIEQNPIESANILPDNSPLQNEAKEITDGDKRTNEVDNEIVRDSIKDYNTPGGFLNKKQNGMLKDTIDWDKVNVYKPEEEHSEWDNVPDFDTSDWTAEMGENPLPEGERPNLHRNDTAIDRMQERFDRDEDFAGPDELPATYEQIVEPGKELSLTTGNEISPIEDEPIEVDYEIISEEVDNDDSIPPEEKEEEKQRRYNLALGDETPEIIGGNSSAAGASVGSGTETSFTNPISMSDVGSSFGNTFKAASSNYSSPSVSTNKPIDNKVEDIKSNAGGGTLPPTNKAASISIGSRQSNSTNGFTTSNGTMSSGATNKTGSSLSVKPAKLPNGEEHTQDYYNGEIPELSEATVSNLENRIKELPEEVAEQWGFEFKYNGITYNDTQLEECSPNQYSEIDNILSRLGV